MSVPNIHFEVSTDNKRLLELLDKNVFGFKSEEEAGGFGFGSHNNCKRE